MLARAQRGVHEIQRRVQAADSLHHRVDGAILQNVPDFRRPQRTQLRQHAPVQHAPHRHAQAAVPQQRMYAAAHHAIAQNCNAHGNILPVAYMYAILPQNLPNATGKERKRAAPPP